MLDGASVLIGVLAAGVWLGYLLLTALRTIRESQWPFFIPSPLARAWEEDPSARGVGAGILILALFVASFTIVPLGVGGLIMLATQWVLNRLS